MQIARYRRLVNGLKRCPLAAACVIAGAFALPASGQWTQWGGPHQDFTASSAGLADKWPEDGPKKLWRRELGEGYSAILVDGERLYTMGRVDGKEAAFCLNAKTGDTLWEHKYDTLIREGHIKQFGEGPRSTPLLSEGKLYTIGVSGKMHCLDAADGRVVWSHGLWDEYEGTFLEHGYSSSAFAYKDRVIVMVGGEGHSLIALNKNDGSVIWKKLDFGNSYSTPKLINLDGEDQLVCPMASEIVGIDPATGDLKWQIPFANQWKQNVSLPVWGSDNHLVISSPEIGTKGVKLVRNGGETKVEELWSTPKVRFYHATPVRVGDYVYGSSGEMGTCFYVAVNVNTGEIGWRKRGLAKATTLYADGKLIILDEEGNLAIAKATPDDLDIMAKVPLLEETAWTVPTLVGKTLYVRDKTQIMALDLG